MTLTEGAAAMNADATPRGETNPFRVAYPPGRSAWASVLGAPFEAQTYLRALHLLLMFPLGIAYFVVFVTLFALGFSLIWTFIGPAVLLVALYATRWLGDMEAWVVRHVGGIELRRPPTAIERGLSFRTQVKTQLVDPTTWSGLAYLVLQFPIGIAAFVGLVTSTTVGGVFALAPVWWVADRPIELLEFNGRGWVLDTPAEAFMLVPFGLAILLLEAHLVKVTSVAHVAWARFALGSRAPHIRPRPGGLGEDGPADGTSMPTPSAPVEPSPRLDAPRPEPTPAPPAPPATAAPQFDGGAASGGLAQATAGLDARLAELTPRELEVLQLIGRGYSNAEIAETFVISEGTVKTHVKRIFAKVGVNDRARAAVLAFDTGVVRPQWAAVDVPVEAASVVPIRRRGAGG
ncbi:MAG: sensor domain-containing protein [Dehalococcoidia bacterium]